jgi:hypothetical protein
MPHLPAARLVNAALDSPHASAKAFVCRGDEWALPDFENAEQFVTRLVREGVLVRDPLVDDVVAGEQPRIGARSVQRRVAAATGLTQGAIRQIERARQAAILLGEGVAPLDVVHRLSYYDQPHLSRSLTRFIGRRANAPITRTRNRHHHGQDRFELLHRSRRDRRGSGRVALPVLQ